MTSSQSKLRRRRLERHRADLISLFFGLLFAAVAGWWAISYYLNLRLDWNVPNFGWFAAGALILIGVLGVVASLRGDRRAAEPVPPPAVTEDPVDDTASFDTAPHDTAPHDTAAFDSLDPVTVSDPVDPPDEPRP